jgi:hypothetical protein
VQGARQGRPGLEREVVFCSLATDCKTCGGALATDCRYCKNEPVEKAMDEKRAAAKKWLEERRAKVDAVCKNNELMHLKTAHVDLTFSVPPLTDRAGQGRHRTT